MAIEKHEFTEKIWKIIEDNLSLSAEEILEKSSLLQYLNIKTRAANRGSKSRAGFGNIYAIYVLTEDYINGKFYADNDYSQYEGAKFSYLLFRQRQLPFGSKLQNHALNHRLNQEFKKYFPISPYQPVIRDVKTNRYWINENLLKISINNKIVNIAICVNKIIDAYIEARQEAFNDFIYYCQQMIEIQSQHPEQAIEFIKSLLRPNIDARLFEIVSYAILKQYYADQIIYWGWSPDELHEDNLVLYKTGRTNANDGGIDFVMKPLGRFFQVTETIDVAKYFLDIDKVQKYPITFVVKSGESSDKIKSQIEKQARKRYPIEAVVKRYMECLEEVINIDKLLQSLEEVLNKGNIGSIIDEIVIQSRVEFNAETQESDTR